jgi:aminotransferase
MSTPTATTSQAPGGTNTVNIFELMDRARARKDVISMGLGDPDLATPSHIVAAGKEAIRLNRTGLAPVKGLPELRRAISRKLAKENGIEADPESEVLITTGGQEALFLVMQALVEPGDEVLMPDPRYTSYDESVELAGGRIVLVPTRQEDAFDLDPDEVEKRLTPASKVLLLVTPSNPTAGIVTPAHIRRLAEIAQERDLIVISDEIYEKFLYDGHQHLSIASLPGMRERTVTLNSVSKTYAMTGWRIGYLAGPAAIVDAVAALKTMVNIQAPTVSQWAALAAFEGPQECVTEMRETYDARRRLLMQALDEMGFSYGEPRGGLYIWANTATSGVPAIELSAMFLDEGVLIFPGTGFGENWGDYMRMTLLQPIDVLAEAITRMRRALAKHREAQA